MKRTAAIAAALALLSPLAAAAQDADGPSQSGICEFRSNETIIAEECTLSTDAAGETSTVTTATLETSYEGDVIAGAAVTAEGVTLVRTEADVGWCFEPEQPGESFCFAPAD
jgi:hypothetical protein